MGQVPDPAYVGDGEPPMVDMFETDEEWVGYKLEEYFRICVSRGEDLQRKDGAPPKLTRDDIFVIKK